ncbi:MAG: aldo/keto reductase [Myxococcales bacterium]|nr:aldo/keto reductase [Myxococcales bacterium]
MVSELISKRPWATEAGTRRFVERHQGGKAADAYSSVAGQLHLSSLGIGTYLGRPDDTTDARYIEAIVEAVRQGINVIDTASNYRCQRSERAVGAALRQLIDMGEIFRSEVLVASKAGFVPLGDMPPMDPDAWFRAQTIDRGLADEGELNCGCHCMAPRYITETLRQSLENLGLETIDVYFLHNPESQLQEVDRETFLDRVRRAFAALETAADEGKIRVYGVATWPGLRAAKKDKDYLSLAELVQCAEDVAGRGHRFKAIQVPLSLHLPEALTLKNQRVHRRGDEELTVLEAARELGLVSFTSGSLHQGRLAKKLATSRTLPDGSGVLPGNEARLPAHTALQFARSAVTSALVGMSSVEHVRANVRTFLRPRASSDWLQAAATQPRGATIGR